MEFGDPHCEPSPCCMNLRCKSMFYRGDEGPGLLHHEDAMTYWCSLTNEALGPDREAVMHPKCQDGRPCYVAPVPL